MSESVIELKNVRKEFVTTKHYPGFKGAVKGLFTKETDKKLLWMMFLFLLRKAKWLATSEATEPENPLP